MAADLKAAMEKGELKKLLVKSKKEPVNCALAQGDGKTTALALIMLDKVKGPKAVEKDLLKEFPEAKNPRFGTAFVDTDVDPTLVKFTINKAASGLAKRLVRALKGTGFKKVQILGEDGSVLEADEEADEQGQAPDSAAGSRGEQPQPPPAAAAGQPQPAAPAPQGDAARTSDPAEGDASQASGQDVRTLTETLVGLVKRLPPIIAADPTQQSTLTELASQAKAALTGRDLDAAAARIEDLRGAIERVGLPAADAANKDASGRQQPAANGPNAAVIGKSRLAWVAARQKVESEIGKLHEAISEVYRDHGAAEHLEKAFQSRVEGMLSTLDQSLAEKLDQVNQAANPGDRARLIADAQGIMQRYQDYLSSEPLIAKMDANPFAPVAVHKTLSATLTALSKSVR